MGKTTGFMEYKRVDESYDAVDKRLKHYKEFTIPVKEKELQNQGARCMDCGIPFCHSGCHWAISSLISTIMSIVEIGKKRQKYFILQITFQSLPAVCVQLLVNRLVF